MNKSYFYLFYLGIILLCTAAKHAEKKDISLFSPDKKIELILHNGNQLSFEVKLNGKNIVENSNLNIILNSKSFSEGTEIQRDSAYTINERYPLLGQHAEALNRANGLTLIILTANHIKYRLELRVFNDAVAYRFHFPGEKKGQTIQESSLFNLPSHSLIWHHDMRMHYEGVHQKSLIDTIKSGTWIAPPATYKTPDGCYASITEANLKNYSGMTLKANGKNALAVTLSPDAPVSYPYELRYTKEDIAHLAKPVNFFTDIITPWRVVLIGKDLNTLVNSDAIPNLNPKPNPAFFPKGVLSSWIKPSPAVWKYLDGGGENTLENMKLFTDGAAKLGFKYNILEGFWSRWSDQDIKELVNYSRKKDVGIFVWVHSKNLRDSSIRRALLQRCHDLGIAGLKIDFFDHEAKEMVDLYQSILKETAKLHLLVDFHGSNKPTGESRTWPNELTREAVKGMETSKLEDRATHQATLPFTRCLAGPAEYTPLHFGERRKNTTWVNQIASAAILSAPMLTYAATPEHILENPGVEMIKSIPAVWDETLVLAPSEIGELAVFARRKGTTWFLAIMNGAKANKIQVPLDFFSKGTYKGLVYTDPENKTDDVVQNNALYNSNNSINIDLKAGGGFIAKFELQNVK